MAIYRVTSLLDNSLLRIRLSNGNSVFINPGESRDVTELNSGMIHAETLGECLITKIAGDPVLPEDLPPENAMDVEVDAVLANIEQPVGIVDSSKINFSKVDATRTMTVTPVGSCVYYVSGKRLVLSSAKSVVWPNTHGPHFFYLDDNLNLLTTTTFSDELITKYAIVALLYWDSALSKTLYLADERHGIKIGPMAHLYLHSTRGAVFGDGCHLNNFVFDGNGTLDSHAQFNASSGSIWDEDIRLSFGPQTTFPVFYRLGSVWKKKDADAFPLIYNGTAGYSGTCIAYNYFDGSSWSLAEVTSNKFALVHVFATNDVNTPYMCILGTQEYLNKTDAKDAALTEIRTLSGMPVAEFAPVASIVFQTNTGYTNTPRAAIVSVDGTYTDHRFTLVRPGSIG